MSENEQAVFERWMAAPPCEERRYGVFRQENGLYTIVGYVYGCSQLDAENAARAKYGDGLTVTV